MDDIKLVAVVERLQQFFNYVSWLLLREWPTLFEVGLPTIEQTTMLTLLHHYVKEALVIVCLKVFYYVRVVNHLHYLNFVVQRLYFICVHKLLIQHLYSHLTRSICCQSSLINLSKVAFPDLFAYSVGFFETWGTGLDFDLNFCLTLLLEFNIPLWWNSSIYWMTTAHFKLKLKLNYDWLITERVSDICHPLPLIKKQSFEGLVVVDSLWLQKAKLEYVLLWQVTWNLDIATVDCTALQLALLTDLISKLCLKRSQYCSYLVNCSVVDIATALNLSELLRRQHWAQVYTFITEMLGSHREVLRRSNNFDVLADESFDGHDWLDADSKSENDFFTIH